jgi:hypothetical protein
MEQNAKHYSLAGLADLAFGSGDAIKNTPVVGAVLGNDVTGTFYLLAGSNTSTPDLVNAGVTAAGAGVTGGMGTPLTHGRRTAASMALNLAGKGGLPQALSSSAAGLKAGLTKLTTFGISLAYKATIDSAFTAALALGCLGPR